MSERLRFTGTSPPQSLWARYPNWQNAYEEEGLPDQDETTLRPADNQQVIDDDVSFSAADVELADGTRRSALLSLIAGEAGWVYGYPDPRQDVCWALRYDVPTRRWVAMNDDWFLKGDPALVPVPVDRAGTFPMRVWSRLPLAATGERVVLEIPRPGGTAG